jgi:Flp pilus assembly protein TadB
MSGHGLQTVRALAVRVIVGRLEGGAHEADRRRFRALAIETPFETVLAWIYGLAFGGFLAGAVTTFLVVRPLLAPGSSVIPQGWQPELASIPGPGSGLLALGLAVVVGLGSAVLVRLAIRAVLDYLIRRRRIQIERTLPGAVRYLHVIAEGTTAPETLFESVVAKERIHGATAASFESILRRARMTGSIETAIRQVARDTPSKDTLAPFLLTFLERTREGPAAVREFLRLESRLLARADEQEHRRETRYLTTVVQLFLLLLVLPVVLIVGAMAGTVLLRDQVPGVPVPHPPELGSILASAGSLVILVLGAAAAFLVYLLRPSGDRWAAPEPAQRPATVIRRSLRNPTNTLLVLLPIVGMLVTWLWYSGTPASRLLLYGYVAVAVPVGLIDVRRARRRAAIDRQLPGFVHAVADRLHSGLPFRTAVERVAAANEFGPLGPHVAALHYDLEVGAGDQGVRKRALERFVGRIGTPLAGRSIGLAVGALEAGADTRSAFAALQTETGRLVHADQARRSRFPVVIAVGWTVALLIVAVVVTVNLMVLDSVTPATAGPIEGVVVDATFGATGREPLFYVITQAAMVASGWFAGVAGRGVYEGLLHSGALVTVTFLVFRVSGLL